MTRRLRPILLRLLVALLMMQGIAAPAHCLERLAWALSVPICGSGGAPDARDHGAPHHGGQDGCVVCHAVPQGPVPRGPALAAPAQTGWVEARLPGLAPLLPGQDAEPYAARAPPRA